MSEQFLYSSTDIPKTNCFLFKGKEYAINVNLFNIFSNYFENIDIKSQPMIRFLDDSENKLPISEEIVELFINYCQNQPLPDSYFNNENVVPLNYLAAKYKVPTLFERTKKYITEHEEHLILSNISFDPDNPKNAKHEEMISKHFTDYVKDPFLLKLPLPILNRIVTKYGLKIDNDDTFYFLLEYIKENGPQASVLFENAEFLEKKTEYLSKLMELKDDEFDYHYINGNAVKSIYDMQNSLLSDEKNLKENQEKVQQMINNQIETLKKMKEEMEENMSKVSQMKESLIQQMTDQFNQLKLDVEDVIRQERDQKRDVVNELKNEIEELKKLIKDQKDEFNQTKELHIKEMKEKEEKFSYKIDQKKLMFEEEYVLKLKNMKAETNSFILSIIEQAKTELNQTKIDIENQTNQAIDQLKREVERIINEQNSSNQQIQLKQKDIEINNCILKEDFDDLKRIMFDADSSNFFSKNNNYETFNKLKGETQWFIVNGIIMHHKDSNFEKVGDLLTYLLKEQQKLNSQLTQQKINCSFITIKSTENDDYLKESLVKFENKAVYITYEAVDILYRNSSLESTEFIGIIKKFDNILTEIKYEPFPEHQPNDFKRCFDILTGIKGSKFDKLKIGFYIDMQETDSFFKGRDIVSSIRLGPSVKIIHGGPGDGSFENCHILEDVTFSDSIEKIKGGAFNNCAGLRKLDLPPNLNEIAGGAFNGCVLLNKLTVPQSISLIECNAFRNCNALSTLVIDPYNNDNRNITIRWNCFDGCNSLKRLIFPSSVKTIKHFELLPRLNEIIIPDSVTSIDSKAFAGCTFLESITIPPSVRTILVDTFVDCTNLKNITMDPYLTTFDKKTFKLNTSLRHLIFYNSVTHIGKVENLSYFGKLKEITIPNSVVSIGATAFQGQKTLEKVNIPNSVVSIEYDAFKGCYSLKEVEIPNSVKYIAGGVFCDCGSLKKIKIPDSVVFLGSGCFGNCNELEEVVLPNSIGTLEQDLFHKCTKLGKASQKKFVVPNSVSSIGGGVFTGCDTLEEIVIPDSVFSIGGGAFYECKKLKKVILPKSIPKIDKSTFKGCRALTDVNIPRSVQSIEDDAFKECTALRSIELTESITFIGEGSFYGCSSITEFNIPNSVSSIKNQAFGSCSSLIRITIPSSFNERLRSLGIGTNVHVDPS